MNIDYKKPVIVANNNLSEGVYLASGAGCYTVDANIISQTPAEGRKNYVIQINATHNADHTRDAQTLYISFNQPVTHVSFSNGNLVGGNNSSTLAYSMSYHQNPTDRIGFGDLTVESADGLTITSVQITD